MDNLYNDNMEYQPAPAPYYAETDDVTPPAPAFPPEPIVSSQDAASTQILNNTNESEYNQGLNTDNYGGEDEKQKLQPPVKKTKKKKSNKIAPDDNSQELNVLNTDGHNSLNNSTNGVVLGSDHPLMQLDGSLDGSRRSLPKLPDSYVKKTASKNKKLKKRKSSIKSTKSNSSNNNINDTSLVSRHVLYDDILPPIIYKRRPKSRQRDMRKPINIYGSDDELPSKLALHSSLGTSLTRQRYREERHNTNGRNHMDEYTLENAQRRGLKLDSQSDNHMDELEKMHQLEVIRQMPVSLKVKRQLREKVLDVPIQEAEQDGCCSLYCYRAKIARLRRGRSCRMACMDIDHSVTLWSGSFKRIEGHFGSGVLTYFMFLKWLFQLNLFIAVVNFIFVTLPMLVFSSLNYDGTVTGSASNTTSAAVNLSIQCSALYTVDVSGQAWYQYLLDLIQGSGFMEKTVLFYGYYAATELDIPEWTYSFNMPLAYLICVMIYFIISLCVMVHNTAKGFRERVFMNHGDFNQFCNKVFGGWDFTIDDEKNAKLIHTGIFRELDSHLEEDKKRKIRKEWTCKKECAILTVRILIWILVLAMLGGAGYLIYYVTTQQAQLTSSTAFSGYHLLVQLLIQYMTSVTITILNALLPLIFKKLILLEHYSSGVSVNITLSRTVFLRLSSLGILVSSIYTEISCGTKDDCNVGTGVCNSLRCWETYVGQEFYKLVIINFFVQFAVIFFVETPRRLIVDHCSCKLSKLLGRQEFDIPKGVLDLIYMEAILWFGSFFCPLIPGITTVSMFLIFYFKYFTVVKNCEPLHMPYRASSSGEFFLVTLLVTYTLCIVPLVYMIYIITPSRGCGPFRIYDQMYKIIPITIDTWPSGVQQVVSFIASAALIVPLFVILCLVIYYLSQVLMTYKSMVSTMKEQLSMENRDKEFLLTKIRKLVGGNEKPKKKPKKPKSAAKKRAPISEDPESVVVEKDPKAKGKLENVANGHLNTPPGVPHDDEFVDEEAAYLASS